MKQLVVFISTIILICSCTSAGRYSYPKKITQLNSSKVLSDPEINKETTRKTGEEIISNDLLLVNRSVLEIKKDMAKPYIKAGFYNQVGENEEMYYFKATRNITVKGMIFDEPIDLDSNLDKNSYLCIKKVDDGNLYILSDYRPTKTIKIEYEKKNADFYSRKEFTQILIFNGLVSNKLKIGYREFNNGTARPAFNNDAEFDLETSKTIGYKGCKIEVIKADNESITYKVLKIFD